MAESSTLKIEVTSTGVSGTPVSSSAQPAAVPVDAKPATFADQKAANAKQAADFREAEKRKRWAKEAEEREAAKVAAQRKRDDQQAKDEGWLAKQEAKEARRTAAENKRAESRQNKDEDYYERQQARDAKDKAVTASRASSRQKKDEDYFDKQQARVKQENDAKAQRAWWNNPGNVAKSMLQRQQFGAAVRGSYMAQRLGFSAESGVAKLASSANVLAGKLHPLIAAAGALYGAWSAARQNLLEEAKRVRYLSPELRMQEQVNKFRNMRTDMEIANKYGERMAEIEDIKNRQENAWRLIGAKVSSAIDEAFKPITEPLEEGYTKVLEWLAGNTRDSTETNKLLEKLTGYTKQQMEEMGIKANTRQAIADAIRNATRVTAALGAADETTNDILNTGFNILGPNADNPGIIPPPDWWRPNPR